jgi:hypothetical protein
MVQDEASDDDIVGVAVELHALRRGRSQLRRASASEDANAFVGQRQHAGRDVDACDVGAQREQVDDQVAAATPKVENLGAGDDPPGFEHRDLQRPQLPGRHGERVERRRQAVVEGALTVEPPVWFLPPRGHGRSLATCAG